MWFNFVFCNFVELQYCRCIIDLVCKSRVLLPLGFQIWTTTLFVEVFADVKHFGCANLLSLCAVLFSCQFPYKILKVKTDFHLFFLSLCILLDVIQLGLLRFRFMKSLTILLLNRAWSPHPKNLVHIFTNMLSKTESQVRDLLLFPTKRINL